MSDIFSEAKLCERFDPNSISSSTTKSLYLSLTETMPPATVILKYPERNYNLTFKRLMSGVLSKNSRTIIYLFIHERVSTRERGFRLMRNRYDSPLCYRGCGLVETPTHKYATCLWVSSAWNKILDLIIDLDQTMVFESSCDILCLNFPHKARDNAILWLIGHYLEFVEDETIIKNSKVTGDQVMGYLMSKYIADRFKAMPCIGQISSLDRNTNRL